ncbi:SHOCT-like domain-containing protein [Terrihalobacillus insolitus]|uniref:SHOCT-like domain-containing protein n=1 Tax=Terrihalobacillus insolitus TaxID=2950438 RepID=UPI002340288F|nr:hypothetical protein [Terrihalobacillus insolitus]MDC3412257.1 hypothetical protein [Terrihalobacillus insolitus]
MKEEQRRILKMVEEGMITAEEAEELMESIEQDDQSTIQEISKKVDWETGEAYKQHSKTKSKKDLFYNLLKKHFPR